MDWRDKCILLFHAFHLNQDPACLCFIILVNLVGQAFRKYIFKRKRVCSMNIKKKLRSAIALVVVVFLGTGLLVSCKSNGDTIVVSKQTDSSTAENSNASSTISSGVASQEALQEAAANFMKIEPAILKTTQNATYTYSDGSLSFTIGTETANFPSKYVSTIFNPNIDFMPSSIFVSANKIAVVRTPDDDSIVITYSDDNGKTWQDSDAIQTEQIPDHSTGEASFFGKDEVNNLLSLYVNFPSKDTGFLIVGSNTTMGMQYTRALFKSTDSGKTWHALDSNIDDPDFPITGMYFINDNNGFIVQSALNVNKVEIRQTTDGGVTWSTYEVPLPAKLVNNYNYPSVTALAPYYSSSQWVLPIFVYPDL